MAVAAVPDERVFKQRAWTYAGLVCAASACLGTVVLTGYGPELEAHWFAVVALAAIGLMATVAPPRVPWVRIVMSADTLPVLVAAVVYGPAAAFVVGVIGTMVLSQLRRRLYRPFVFNRGALGMSAALAALVYRAVMPAGTGFVSLAGAAAFVAALATLAIVNQVTLAAYIAVLHGSRVGDEARAMTHQALAMAAGALTLGPLVLACYYFWGADGFVFLVVPVVAVNAFLGRYQAYTKAFLDGVETLATALGAKDQVTLEHSRRVGEYAAQIARQMRMSETQVGVMYYNGLLHDAGKLGVCDDLLKKPAAFTADEYEQIKVHAALGEQFTQPFWKVDRAVRRMNYVSYHHERWDGRGYPRGLSGDLIPLGGRILAVADAYDAMTQDRPYHQGIAPDMAFKEIIRCAGAQFDPAVVKAFLECQGAEVPATFERRVRAQELMAQRRDIVKMRQLAAPTHTKA